MKYLAFAATSILTAATAEADPARVEAVSAQSGAGGWTFSVTLSHGDTENDWANAWQVESETGEVYGTRTLFHPHIDEQPFTRSQSSIVIPPEVRSVRIRTSTTTDGWAEATTTFVLPEGPEG